MPGHCRQFLLVSLLLGCTLSALAQEKKTMNILTDAGAFELAPQQTITIEFILDKKDADKSVAVAFSAFARHKQPGGFADVVHLTVNRQFMRTRVLDRARLLNKPMSFNFGPQGKRHGQWTENSFWKSIGFPGSALWRVPYADSLESFLASRDYAPAGLKDPVYTVINISDLVTPGQKNFVMIHNVSDRLTLVFDRFSVQVGKQIRNADKVIALREQRRSLRKRTQTFYTPDRVAAARENVKRYQWAKDLYSRIMDGERIRYYTGATYTSAKEFVAQSDEFMWLLQPTSKLERHVLRGSKTLRCPIHEFKGKEAKWPGAAWCPWRIDPINHPYKIQCLAGNEWLPTNDYHLGDMTGGKFPDDGSGCLHQGQRYKLLAEYAHMVYGSVVVPTLNSLSQAYLLTGDPEYAHKGCILLARLATEYPNHEDRRDRLYDKRELGPYNGRGSSMMTDDIWENACLEQTAYAYDAFFDYMATDDKLIAFLKTKGMPIDNAADLRAYIEDNLIRSGMKALLLKMIKGNEGMHQAAAMACALVIDDFADTRVNTTHMIDYFYYGVGQGANILINAVTPDGGGHESPNYNRIKLALIRAVQLMENIRAQHPEQLPLDKYPDISASPKTRALFDYFLDIFMCDSFVPSIGDAGGIGPLSRANPSIYTYPELDYLFAFERYGDPRYARACTTTDGSLRGGQLFTPYPEKEIRAALKQPESQLVRTPRIMDDYGLAILESGQGKTSRAVYLNYFPWHGHKQRDNLAIGFSARKVDLMPDLGYPYTYEHRWQWDCNSMAHNTVTVDETQYSNRSTASACRLFASAGGVHLVTASHHPYPPEQPVYPEHFQAYRKDARACDLFERTLILVDVDATRYYVVDLFAVNGGEQHDQSWHGPLVPVQPPQLNWKIQQEGTLAGPEVKQFSKWTDRWGRKREDFPAYLAAIRRTQLDQPARWTWQTGLPEGDTLNLHLIPVGGAMEVIGGTGRSPAWPNNWALDYLLARRLVKDGSRSLFLSVMDAFQKTPVVKEVHLLSENPIKLAVIRDDGQDEITLQMPDGPSLTTAHRPLGARVQSTTGGKQTRDIRIGACGDGNGYIQTIISKVDYNGLRIGVQAAAGLENDLRPGIALRIFNPFRTALYRVQKTERSGELLWITLDRTALLACASVEHVEKDRLMLDAELVFSTSRAGKDGKLEPEHDPYRGAWLFDGEHTLQMRGVVGQNTVYLEEPHATAARNMRGKTVTIHQYNVGDSLELARVRE